MKAFCSTHPRDQLFGACMDAYQYRWTGACFAHPPHTTDELERAVRWALASAKEADRQCPVLIVMLLPESRGHAPYERWLEYPEVVSLAKFSGDFAMPFLAADSWQGGQRPLHHPDGTAYELVAIGNDKGRAELLRQDFATSWDGLPEQLGVVPLSSSTPPWPWTKAQQGKAPLRYDLSAYNGAVEKHMRRCQAAVAAQQEQYKPPRKLAAAARSTDGMWGLPPGWSPAPDPAAAMRELYGQQQYRLRYNWRLAHYTDGSVQSEEGAHLVGAAVYVAAERRAYLIRPNGDGPADTINRAELAAIYHAVTHLIPAKGPAEIFTDSQASIGMLHKAVTQPHRLGNHLHRTLLLSTAEQLVRRANAGRRTAIQKVPAHSGNRGNEEAE